MTTDNRTNEPNKYAGYLARQEHQRDRWRGIGVKCLCGKVFDLDADHALHQVEEILRAALVAATRVPVHGEPNDGATQDRIAEIACTALGHRQGGDECMTDYAIADAILAEFTVLSRATVPDAATAAIARVRAIHKLGWQEEPYGNGRDGQVLYRKVSWCLHCDMASPCDTLAALDGAPEPEALELPETGLEVRDGDGDLITTGEHRRVLHQGGYVCDTCVNILGINVRWDRADRMEGHPLPVEGEADGA